MDEEAYEGISPLEAAAEEEDTEEEVQSPLAAIDPVRAELLRQSKAAEERRASLFQTELNRIEKAKQKLLEQPTELSRKEMLRAIASKLTQRPVDQRDPRFWERQNLFTMLRDIGELGGEVSAAEKKLKAEQEAKVSELEGLRSKYMLGEAERGASQAASALARYRPPAGAKGTEYSPSEGRQYVFTNPEAAGVASGRAPQVFRKDLGYGYIDDEGNFRPAREAPTGTRVVTSGALNPVALSKFDDRQLKFTEELIGLEKMQDYFKNVTSLDRGFKNLANRFIADIKNFIGKPVEGKQFSTLEASAQQQALLGAIRLEVLGGGVLTEIDAQRLINTLGGDMASGKMNPDLVAARLKSLYKEKRQRADLQSRMLKRDANLFGYDPEEFSLTIPATLGGDVLRQKPPEEKPRDRATTSPPRAAGETLPKTKRVGNETWTLQVDAKGNRAYVSPDGKKFEEVR